MSLPLSASLHQQSIHRQWLAVRSAGPWRLLAADQRCTAMAQQQCQSNPVVRPSPSTSLGPSASVVLRCSAPHRGILCRCCVRNGGRRRGCTSAAESLVGSSLTDPSKLHICVCVCIDLFAFCISGCAYLYVYSEPTATRNQLLLEFNCCSGTATRCSCSIPTLLEPG